MIRRQFARVWEQLRAKRPQLENFLEEVRIQALHGIEDLTVRLTYPVSVLAGPNASGKTTVLFALACGYKVPESGIKDFVPSTMFPDFQRAKHPADHRHQTAFEFYYIHHGQRQRMRWTRGTNWNRSYLGLKEGRQPERQVYLRTLANLSNPSEVRSVLQMGRFDLAEEEVTADLLAFAHRILPLRYRRLIHLSRKNKDLLFAEREDGQAATYSEFHMSAGERAILRLSRDLSQLSNALVLIDEIEAGLHPLTQQQLLLELQRLALRNDLQIVVTTHSPVVLDCVPPEGRIFLERTDGNVVVQPPYRDLIQNAFYGHSLEKLYILCEDEVAEALLRGVLDVLNPRLNLLHSDLEVGRDTGKDEFPQHVRALAKFGKLSDFLLVLDGDARPVESRVRQAAQDFGQPIRLLFLPGNETPETWIWGRLARASGDYAREFGLPPERFRQLLEHYDQTFAGAADTPVRIAKQKLELLAEELRRETSELCRAVGRLEAARESSGLDVFTADLKAEIESWRTVLV
jgi:predicted ATPase